MRLSVILLLSIAGITGFAQAQLPDGNYEVSLNKSVQLMNAGTKARYDSLPSHIKVKANESMTGKKFAFQENGSITVQWKVNNENKATNGTWQLNSSGDKLSIAAGGIQVEYEVAWEGSNGLILRNNNGGGLFTSLYLEKN